MRHEQHHHTDATPDTVAARWTDTAASMSTDHQLHDSTVGEQGDASTADGQTNVDGGNVERDTLRQGAASTLESNASTTSSLEW